MTHDKKIRESLEYIEKNLRGEIRLEKLSDIVHLSKYHYHRLFHEATGESVKRYVDRRRMADAAAALVRTDARILDIALDYQFGSQEAFTRAFRRYYGMTPGEYRRQHAIRTGFNVIGRSKGGSGRVRMAA